MATKEVEVDVDVPVNEVLPSIRRHLVADGFPFVLDLEKSRGSLLRDAATGIDYLDFYSFFASLPIGFNHPGMCDERSNASVLSAARAKVANGDTATKIYADFVTTLERTAAPKGFPHYFFVEGGGLAVENAMKAAFDWKSQKNESAGKTAAGSQILHFEHAFHGRTGYTMSCTNTEPNKVARFPKFPWPRVSSPALRFPLNEANLAAVEEAETRAIAAVHEAFDKNPDDIAAILIEPIQSEGGDRHFRAEFLQALRKIADEREALLIFDEVQTGLGATGRWWAYEHFGVEPDLISASKKLQLGAVFASKRLDEVPENVFVKAGRISSTWGGGLVDMARATRILEIMAAENVVENAELRGNELRAGLEALQKKYPAWLSNARGLGLICAVDLADTATRDRVQKRCLAEEMIVLACGPRTLRFRPTLTVPADAIAEGLVRLERALCASLE
jgi:L-lysine 6-transaminase